MGKSYSSDLRVRICGAIEDGASRRAAAHRYGVSVSTSVRVAQRMSRIGRQARSGARRCKTLLATEAGRDDVVAERRVCRGNRQPRMRQEPHRLAFIDETATTTKMTRLRGRARRGQRLKARAPFGHWGTQTFIAALRCDGLTAPWIINKPMNRKIFETYVDRQTQGSPPAHRSTHHR